MANYLDARFLAFAEHAIPTPEPEPMVRAVQLSFDLREPLPEPIAEPVPDPVRLTVIRADGGAPEPDESDSDLAA